METLREAGKMFAEGAGGVVLGLTCESFLQSIEKCCVFDYPALESVRSTVENLKEVIPKMDDHNMKLGDRQDELKELKEEMERGTILLEQIFDSGSLFYFKGYCKGYYNDRLDELDASLKSLVSKLPLQSALDVKEMLVLERENVEAVKSTKRKVDDMSETLENMHRIQEQMNEMMKKQKMDDWASQAELLLLKGEGAALATKLRELADAAAQGMKENSALPGYRTHLGRIRQVVYDVFLSLPGQASEVTYIPVSIVKSFRIAIEDGVTLLRSCLTITEWTEELKKEYTIKFRALENTLEGLYSCLAGLQPFKWRCGKCDESLGATSTSTSLVNPAGSCR